MKLNNIYLILQSNLTNKQFTKYFNSEFEKDKFKRKLKYSKKLIVINDSTDPYN